MYYTAWDIINLNRNDTWSLIKTLTCSSPNFGSVILMIHNKYTITIIHLCVLFIKFWNEKPLFHSLISLPTLLKVNVWSSSSFQFTSQTATVSYLHLTLQNMIQNKVIHILNKIFKIFTFLYSFYFWCFCLPTRILHHLTYFVGRHLVVAPHKMGL